jgi:hypothetical protein
MVKSTREMRRWVSGNIGRSSPRYSADPISEAYHMGAGTVRLPGQPACRECGTYTPRMEMIDEMGRRYEKCRNCGFSEA